MEFRIEELRIGNMFLYNGKQLLCNDEILISILDKDGLLMFEKLEPLPLTKEILRDNLGFDISDMGDFWQCQREDFILIQVKISFGTMPYMFVLKSSIKESVNFYYVHHLQNTYLDLKGELLQWKG